MVPRAKFYSLGNQGVKNGWDLRERETLPVESLGKGGVIFPQKLVTSYMDGTLPPREMDLCFNKKNCKENAFSGTSGMMTGTGLNFIPRGIEGKKRPGTLRNGFLWFPLASLGKGGVIFSQKTGDVIYGRYLATACKGLFFLLGSGLQS